MFKSGFFNSEITNGNPDRTYAAEDFSEYFASFVGNGVFANPATSLQVMENDPQDMTVVMKAGTAWIDGYFFKNNGDYIFSIDPADGSLERIDSIIIQWNLANREITAYVKKGEFSITPIAPSLERTDSIYELSVAEVYVNAGATNITQADITDKRPDSSVCGWVTGLFEVVDSEELFIQQQTALGNWFAQQQVAFDNWFANIQGTLSGDVAGALQNQINEINSELSSAGAVTETVLIKPGETISVYDVVDIIDNKAQKTIGSSFSEAEIFDTNEVKSISVDLISENKLVVAYRDGSNSDMGYARIISVNEDGSLSLGPKSWFEVNSTISVSIKVLNSTKILVVYSDSPDSYKGKARIGTISNLNLAFSTEYTFNSEITSDIELEVLSEAQAVAIFKNRDANSVYSASAVLLNISGTVVTPEPAVEFQADSSISFLYTKVINTTKVLVTYRHNSGEGRYCIGTVSGSSLTFTSPQVFASNIYQSSFEFLDENKIMFIYRDSNNNDYGTMLIGTINGSTIAFENPEVLINSAISYILITKYDENKLSVGVVTNLEDITNIGKMFLLYIDGTTVTVVDERFFQPKGISYPKLVNVNTTKNYILYQNRATGEGELLTHYTNTNISIEAIVTRAGAADCDVIFSGIHADESIYKGTEIVNNNVSNSVRGYAPKDGIVAVQGHWERG